MNKNIAISFEHVSKMYRLGLVGTGTLSQDLNRWWKMNVLRQEDPYLKLGETNDRASKGKSDYVYALKDISFDVEQGDVVGIIGKNGAGKSTLLKLLSRITAPSTGSIKARGRIASLLEVGTGFHPELTGRENIYMNGSIMGMTRREIDRKLDEIVDFAGIERYLDTPTKRYSSGMTVRLGFAVAAFLEPEILVVDEVLAVGDAEFQKKAIGKMQDVAQGEGRTVLFVSHNMDSVRQLCRNGIVLKNGQIDFVGEANTCVDYYTESNISELISESKVTSQHRQKGLLQEIEFLEAKLLNNPFEVATDEALTVELLVRSNNSKIKECQYSFIIGNESDVHISNYVSAPMKVPQDKKEYVVRMSIPHPGLPKGKYQLSFASGIKDFSLGSRNYDAIHNLLSFEVKYTNKEERKAYIAWNKAWGIIVHNQECMDVEIL